MTIMLAGGMTIAAPSMMVPEAAAAGSLYVSAENAMFGNTFGGAQIIEVVVIDSNRNQTDEKQGEPVVKVDENQLRMAQGVDGNWYGYFGDSTAVPAADIAANNLNYGTDANPTLFTGDVAEATNVFVYNNMLHTNQADGVIRNAPALSAWNGTDIMGSNAARASQSNSTQGQIGVQNGDQWPFIQLYDFTIGQFDVVYEQAGADEVVSLDYNSADLDDFASMTIDRSSASQGSEVHLVITDNQLNIDPTAEDVVIFYVADGRAGTTIPNGVSFTNSTLSTYGNEDFLAFDNTFDDNGKLLITNNTNGGNSIFVNDVTLDDTEADVYVVFFEGGENSGIFYNTDDGDNSNIDVDDYAKRGFTATLDYNDSAQSFVVANDFGVIDMDASSVGDSWNSGEALTVTLIDQDLNKNTASDEDLVILNTTTTHLIPSLQIGSPLLLAQNNTATNGATITHISNYSNIAYMSDSNGQKTGNFTVYPPWTGTEITAMSDDTDELAYFNYDFSALLSTEVAATGKANATNTMDGVCITDSAGKSLACGTDAKQTVRIMGSTSETGLVPSFR
jgi:hypothetical protein